MKKLMFAAALVGSVTAFGVDTEGFEAADGVYNVSMTKKYVEPLYGYPTEYDYVEGYGETKAEAQAAAKEELESLELADLKKLTTTTTGDAEEGYTCVIAYSYTDTEAEPEVISGKIKSATINGILVKGDFNGEFVQDGTFMTWEKSQFNRNAKGKYYAASGDEGALSASAMGSKAYGRLCVEGEEATLTAIAFGSASLGQVKTLSGNFVEDLDDASEMNAFGTWKIQKDAAATRLAEAGKDLETILNKKGATEATID